MSASIKDVARKAGVSIASVSRVLTGSPGVSKKTESVIREVIKELGYRPNLGARGLVNGQTKLIAVVFPRDSSFILGNPFFSRILEGIAEVLDRFNYNTLISFTFIQQKRLIETQAVDGVILFSPRTSEISLEWLKQTVLTIVVIGSYLQDSPYPVVRPDDENGIRMSFKELYKLGHQKIGLVNGPMNSIKSQNCLKGFKRSLSEYGLPFASENVIEVPEFNALKTRDTVKQFLSTQVDLTGVICVSDFMAMGVLNAAVSCGLTVPNDLSIIGFGDVPSAEFFIPPLSTIHIDLIEIGRQAALVLINNLQGESENKKEYVFPMKFISRGTTAPPNIRNEEL